MLNGGMDNSENLTAGDGATFVDAPLDRSPNSLSTIEFSIGEVVGCPLGYASNSISPTCFPQEMSGWCHIRGSPLGLCLRLCFHSQIASIVGGGATSIDGPHLGNRRRSR
ncbi:hypothetical protein LIER_36168 [Lithospermum erythrorhizon]|uniref:Uncharacterized protein n=1 Tax=Lithospermum erythrorhizon TaxID=34254 RepID=A0AAV3P6Y2_LITER